MPKRHTLPLPNGYPVPLSSIEHELESKSGDNQERDSVELMRNLLTPGRSNMQLEADHSEEDESARIKAGRHRIINTTNCFTE